MSDRKVDAQVVDGLRAPVAGDDIDARMNPKPISEEGKGRFRARLDRRADVWWQTRTPGVHGPGACHERRLAGDPEEQWRCCGFWQRKLSNKWNAREFAKRHGVRVPRLLWTGRDVEAIPFDRLPDSYAVRLTSGHGGKQVVVMQRGLNLLDGIAYEDEQIRARFADLLAAAYSRTVMLVEEYVPPRDSESDVGLPTDYRFHMFGAFAGLISVSCGLQKLSYYLTDWSPPPVPALRLPTESYPWPRPVQLERMLELAGTLGRAIGSYVRVDLYASDGDPVFAEFSPMPGRGRGYSSQMDAHLDGLWEQHCPGTL